MDELVLDFSQRLAEAAELAAIKRGQLIIDALFSHLAAQGHGLLGKAATKQADRDRNQVLAALTRDFLDALEKPLRARVRDQRNHELGHGASSRAHAGAGELPAGHAAAHAPVRRKPRRAQPNPRLPPPLDPEQIKRDQEFARLRALLRPVAIETIAPAPAPVFVAPQPVVQRPASPGDVLRALEKEIQNAVPTLGTLGPERCGAQIAAWVGQVRGLRDRLSPDIAAAMRPAFRIFLEHLSQLREQMEAHTVDALEPNWKAPDWDAYVEVNRARAEQRAPDISTDRQHNYHRMMLRTLVLPHRRHVPGQAAAIISAAEASLHPEDSLLQSAIRRHRSAAPAQAPAGSGSPLAAPPLAEVAPAAPADLAPHETLVDTLAEVSAPVPAPAAPLTAENEFASTWTK